MDCGSKGHDKKRWEGLFNKAQNVMLLYIG